ncbi:14011_t:CDS:2 [Rhizophagus irregularis]|nr:14011_t:CDS:2 [Rhizophagus irregularis]
MATIITASPLNLDQLIKRKNAQKVESPSKEKDGKVKATFTTGRYGDQE